MRQAGLKPKSHSSGTYWIRANANRSINKGEGVVLDSQEKSTTAHTIEWIAVICFVLVCLVGMLQ